MSNQTGIGEKLKSYLKHPGSFIVMLLVMLGAIITFAVLLFLIAYILINGVPHITGQNHPPAIGRRKSRNAVGNMR